VRSASISYTVFEMLMLVVSRYARHTVVSSDWTHPARMLDALSL
jgi:hypothetical protein